MIENVPLPNLIIPLWIIVQGAPTINSQLQSLDDSSGALVQASNSACGARCYLAVAGGINTPLYLGSRSTFPGGKLGGIQVSALSAASNG